MLGQIWVFNRSYRDKKVVVNIFVRFRAPLHLHWKLTSSTGLPDHVQICNEEQVAFAM
jgi:hypothetical protein